MKTNIELSIIAPMFNEEAVLAIFFECLSTTLKQIKYEVICVNDGSNDNTYEVLKQYSNQDPRIKIVNLSRNFGKEIALTAGIDFSVGKAVIPIDCDLQDPPELIIEMYQKWKEGYQVVLAKRVDRQSDTAIKRSTSSFFYKFINKISDIQLPENVGDFRLMDRAVINALKTYPERLRFMKGLFASLGFKQITVEYIRPKRAAGVTSWNYFKLYSLAIEGVVSFTSFPLKIWSYIGLSVALFSFFYGLFLIIRTLIYGVDLPGYSSIMVVILFMSGLILTSLGVLGEYIARIFIETKGRPIYIVMDTIGLDDR